MKYKIIRDKDYLHKKTLPVVSIAEGQKIADELISVLDELKLGIGLSAIQIGILKSVSVIRARKDSFPVVLMNPVVTELGTEKTIYLEGCLSIPGIRGLVTRSKQIRVLGGIFPSHKPVIMEYEGFAARVFQHEIDHLQGKLFIDRVESTLDLVTEQEYARIRLESGGTK